jgi:hypothetical protein
MNALLISLVLGGFVLTEAGPADEVTGTWKVVGDVFGNDVETVCRFTTSPGFAGACTADNRTAPATHVTLNGETLSWDWDAGRAVLSFKGALKSTTEMTGTIHVSFATGHFTAEKQ